eukprot:gene11155-12434_t
MNAQEELELPPWEKFRRYGYFPFKLVLHVSLVALVTALVFITNITFAPYSRAMWTSTVSLLFPSDYTDYQSDLNSPFQYNIYSQNQTIADSNRLVQTYFLLPELSLNDLVVYANASTDDYAPTVTIHSLDSQPAVYPLTPSSSSSSGSWPLDYRDLDQLDRRAFFSSLRFMDFSFALSSRGYSSAAPLDHHLCFLWRLRVRYDMTSAAQIVVTAQPYPSQRCGDRSEGLRALGIVIFLLAAAFQLLLLKAVGRQLVILHALHKQKTLKGQEDRVEEEARENEDRIRRALRDSITPPPPPPITTTTREREEAKEETERSESGAEERQSEMRKPSLALLGEEVLLLRAAVQALSWRDALRIVNLWFLVSSVGNFFALVVAARISFFGEDLYSTNYLKACLGVCCLMLWFSLSHYLEYFPRYYVMISMLKITAPRVSAFLLGVLPLFTGYALLGLICFGDVSDRFGDLTETLRTLFAVVNGDVIYDNFNALDYFAGLGGQLYLYIYVLLFTYVVLMTIIAIVEEAFFAAQKPGDGKTAVAKKPQLDMGSSPSPRPSDPLSPSCSSSQPSLLPRLSSTNSATSTMGKRDLPDHLRILLQKVDDGQSRGPVQS